MLVKIQQIDTTGFQIMSSVKIPATVGVPVSPPPYKAEVIEKLRRNQQGLELPNGILGPDRRVHRQPHDRGAKFSPEPEPNNRRSLKNPDGGEVRVGAKIANKRSLTVKFRPGSKNGVVDKAHARCSTKWARYGGCIPAILEALETVSDLDEALRPWEESLSNKERTIILKEQTSWERALEIFKWFKKGCYELNVIHYNIMLRVLGKARRWSLIESLWNEMGKRGIAPINSTYGTLIDVYGKGGLREEALGWLVLMKKQGMEPDEVTMGIVVQTYKKAGEFGKAEEFFKNWSLGKPLTDEGAAYMPKVESNINGFPKGRVLLSSYTYNTLIDTFGKAGQLKEASETFEHMLRDGIVPNIVTFNTMIHIYGNHGRLGEVASLMHKMGELRCAPDTRTYNILISLYAKHDDIQTAANYFRKMKEASLEPDLVSYRTLLYAFSIRHMVVEAEELIAEMDERGLEVDEYTQSALTRMYIEAGLLEKSWLWFVRFHLQGTMSSECYSANIDAYGERGHVLEAEKVFNCCLEYKRPNVREFNVMVKAYGINKRYDKACQLFDSMEKYDVLPDMCSYNSLIQMLASANLPHLAILYLRKMQKAGLVSDCIPYCAVISSFVKLALLERATGVFEEMIAVNVKPDVVVYGVLINAFADSGSVGEAVRYLNAMRDAGIPMNEVIYNSLIKLYTRVGYLKEAEEAYEMLKSLEAGPDLYSSNCMIDLYSERSLVTQAEEVFESLQRKGLTNEFSFAMMLCMYKRLGRLEEAFQIAQKMRERGLLTEVLSYNHVLGLYALDGRFREAVRTFKEMIKSSIQPDDSTFKPLGVILVKCGVPEKAVGNLELTRRKDPQSGLQEWMSTLTSVVCTDTGEVDVIA